jgi:hypothetical protein
MAKVKSEIDIKAIVKNLKPKVSDRVLKNHQSVYNVCFKNFKNDDFINKPDEIKKFYEERYKNIKSRKSNYYILKTICIAMDKKDVANKLDEYAKAINKILEDEKKAILTKIDKEDKPKEVNDKKIDPWEEIFKDLKSTYLNLKKEALDLYDPNKSSYTFQQLKKIRNWAIASFYIGCFIEDDLYSVRNPPRRNEIRLIRLSGYLNPKSPVKNYLIKPLKNLYYFSHLLYNEYKQSAFKIHGSQSLKVCKEITHSVTIYLKTHQKFLIGKYLFPNYMYAPNAKVMYQPYDSAAWSKLLKRIIGHSCNDCRKAFVTKAYKTVMPQDNSIKQLAYRMGHSFATAMEHYNKIPKNIK